MRTVALTVGVNRNRFTNGRKKLTSVSLGHVVLSFIHMVLEGYIILDIYT